MIKISKQGRASLRDTHLKQFPHVLIIIIAIHMILTIIAALASKEFVNSESEAVVEHARYDCP